MGTDRMGADPLLDAALAETGWLRALARSLVHDAGRADDAVQAALARALERRPARRSLRAWLAAVLRNELRQERRARGRRALHEGRAARADAAPSAREVNERLELQRLLLEAVRALEEPYRATIAARFFEGLPPRAIARRDGVPVKTVDTRLERGLARLRARLDGAFGGERGAWLRALAPFAGAPGGLGPWIGEGVGMGTKAKGIAAVVVAGLGLVWVAERVRAPEPRSQESAPSAQATLTRAEEEGPAADASGRLASATAPDASREARLATTAATAPDGAAPGAEAAGATLEVQLEKRHTGAAAAGAELSVRGAPPGSDAGSALLHAEERPLARAEADAAGRARLAVPAARALWLAVDPRGDDVLPDGRPERVQRTAVPVEPLAPGETRALVIALEHGDDRLFEGRVVAAEDERPLAGATVLAEGSYGPMLATDASGYFALPYSSWDPPTLVWVECDGFTAEVLRPRWLDAVPGVALRVALEREARITARIEGERRDGLELQARWDQGLPYARGARLDATGRAEIAVAARRPLEVGLRTSAGEFVWRDPEPWTLAPGEVRELGLRLGSGTLVYGRLCDAEGVPVAGAELWAVRAGDDASAGDVDPAQLDYLDPGRVHEALVAHTGPDGRYEFTELAGGAWWLGPAPRADGWTDGEEPEGLAPAARRVLLAPGTSALRVDLVTHRGLWIRGVVQGEDGHALADIHVACGRGGFAHELRERSDGAGRFRVGPLVPGTHHLRAFGGDGVFGWPSETTAAEAGAADVVLVLPARNAIGGRVVDGAARAVDAHVHLLRRNGSLGQGTSRREPGAFLFIGLEPGRYSVQAEAPDGRVAVASVELAPGGRVADVELVLAEGTRIGVRHDLGRYTRCAIWAGDALAADATVRRGAESFETVPAGPLRVELYSGDEVLAVRELVGRAGRVESVDFDLVPGD